MRNKNYITALLLLFFCSAAFAQTEKGTFVLSGKTDLNFLFSKTTIGTDSIETGKLKSNQYGFTAGVGYFIANNFSLGIYGTWLYNYSESETLDNPSFRYKNIVQSYTLLPQFSYYFHVEGKLKPLVGGGIGYAWVEERDSRIIDNNNRLYSLRGPSFVGVAGISYFINKSISFDLGLQYSYNKLKDKVQPEIVHKENVFAARLGISAFF